VQPISARADATPIHGTGKRWRDWLACRRNPRTPIEMSAIGGPETRTSIESVFRDVMGAMSGDWRVAVVGSQLKDVWELKIQGPKTNRRYKLYGADGQH